MDTTAPQGLLSAGPAVPLLGILGALVLWAAVSDLRRFVIPNACAAATAVGGLVWQVAVAGSPGTALLVAAGVLAVGFALFARGLFGAGDAKLMAAVSLWAGTAEILPFLIETLVIGGGLALVWVALGLVDRTLAAHGVPYAISPPRRLPYGVAIAGGTGLLIARFAAGGL